LTKSPSKCYDDCYWRDSNWITKDFPIAPKEIKVDNEKISVENVTDRWVSEDSDCFYYEVNKITPENPQ